MPYIWTDTETIQNFLSAGSRIEIGDGTDDVPETSAQLFENKAVDEISTLLSAAWDGVYDLDASTASRTLKWMAAQLAASSIAIVNIGGSLASMPSWVSQYRSDVLGQASRMVINYETVSMPESCTLHNDLDLEELLLKIKLRVGEMVSDV